MAYCLRCYAIPYWYGKLFQVLWDFTWQSDAAAGYFLLSSTFDFTENNTQSNFTPITYVLFAPVEYPRPINGVLRGKNRGEWGLPLLSAKNMVEKDVLPMARYSKETTSMRLPKAVKLFKIVSSIWQLAAVPSLVCVQERNGCGQLYISQASSDSDYSIIRALMPSPSFTAAATRY